MCGTDPAGVVGTERTCTRTAGGWTRTGSAGVERIRVVDGRVLRASGPRGARADVLDAALSAARPMDDRYYRHLLLGE